MKPLLIATAVILATAMPAASQDEVSALDNPEMAAILAADQAIRQDVAAILAGGTEALVRVYNEDALRRKQVKALLDAGTLRTGADFYAAALVYQHGDTAKDYLIAHSLAVAALSEGSTEARWLAAATLDRYLHKIGQPQIYGTQTVARQGAQPTRDPFDHALIPDSIRTVLNVSTRAAEEARQEAETDSDQTVTPQ